MLVLSRRVNESIVIDGCITVTIVSVDGKKIGIGITAPPDVCVDREEIHLRRQTSGRGDKQLAEVTR